MWRGHESDFSSNDKQESILQQNGPVAVVELAKVGKNSAVPIGYVAAAQLGLICRVKKDRVHFAAACDQGYDYAVWK